MGRSGLAAAAVGLIAIGAGVGVATAAEQHAAAACSPSGTSLTLTAKGHKFDKDCLAVPDGESFTIRFDNQDADRHSVALVPSKKSSGDPLYTGNILAGPKSALLSVAKLKEGTYAFQCDVHPNLMNGTFIVGNPAPVPAPTAATPTTASPRVAAAADPPMVDPAPKAGVRTIPEPATPRTASATSGLPRTGPVSHALLLLSGLALAIGGLAVAAGARKA